ncbi:hypothetical protein BASA50_007460 [Batrachochytrium salamandrivorans]|uniref:Uncharacterized protein n=1 Tax=Batrachochytrium salamandrivorans TaxID=1357716 RepID=A0ABQ8F6Y7_9FUNG|nr:hypothetical protein BASA50_007460 [Batrachochytrium salamandrivorans]
MCVVFFIQNHPKYRLVVAGNRDEYLDRPTARAHYWDMAPDVLAGTDKAFETNYKSQLMQQRIDTSSTSISTGQDTPELSIAPDESNGTWMGITRHGKFAFITNHREPLSKRSPTAKSRGFLVRDFLLYNHTYNGTEQEEDVAQKYALSLEKHANEYGGFNLIVGDVYGKSWYIGNRMNVPITGLNSGVVYGLSNGVLLEEKETWPKVKHGKELFELALDQAMNDRDLLDKLLLILSHSTPYSHEQLPPNMFDYELEASLSPICINRERLSSGKYATRTHTVMIVNHDNHAIFAEVERYHLNPNAKSDDLANQYSQVNSTNVFEFTLQ